MHKKLLPRTYATLRMIALALLLGLNALTVSANVTIDSFTATPLTDAIQVKWDTSAELTTVSFNLYRATSDLGTDASLWGEPLDQQAAKGEGNTGASYQYRDTDIEPGVRYYYLLQELVSSGAGGHAGPIFASLDLPPKPTNTATATTTRTATATRQFTNTPTTFPSVTLGPEGTRTPTPTATAQVITPPPTGGTVGAPTVALPVFTQVPVATTVLLPTPEPTTTTPVSEPEAVSTPDTTATPQVFAAATTSPALLETATRPTSQPISPANNSRHTPLLLLGGGAMALAGLLGAAGVLIWRASRPR